MWTQDSIRQAIATACSDHVSQQCGFASSSSSFQATTRECRQRADKISAMELLAARGISPEQHYSSLGQNLSRSLLGNPPNCNQFNGTGGAQSSHAAGLQGASDPKTSPARMEATHSWMRDFNAVSMHTTFMGSSLGSYDSRVAWMKNSTSRSDIDFENVLLFLGGLALAAVSFFGLFGSPTTTPLRPTTQPAVTPFWMSAGQDVPDWA